MTNGRLRLETTKLITKYWSTTVVDAGNDCSIGGRALTPRMIYLGEC